MSFWQILRIRRMQKNKDIDGLARMLNSKKELRVRLAALEALREFRDRKRDFSYCLAKNLFSDSQKDMHDRVISVVIEDNLLEATIEYHIQHLSSCLPSEIDSTGSSLRLLLDKVGNERAVAILTRAVNIAGRTLKHAGEQVQHVIPSSHQPQVTLGAQELGDLFGLGRELVAQAWLSSELQRRSGSV